MRIQRALDVGTVFAIAGAGAFGLAVALAKTGGLGPADTRVAFIAAASLPILGLILGAARPVPRLLAAQLLDRSHALRDRIASALSFLAVPEGERTLFMRAAIEDACARASSLSPRRAMPLRAPRDLVAAAGITLGVGGLWLLEVPREVHEAELARLTPLLLHPDDIEAFQNGLDQLSRDPEMSDELRAAAREFNRIVEDLAEQRLDRTEALRRLSELERHMLEGRHADSEQMRESMRRIAHELERSAQTRDAAEALRDADAPRAERAMRELAAELRRNAPSRAELDRMRDALRRAAAAQLQSQRAEIERRRQEVQRMLQRQQQQKQTNERDRRLLERRRRELERLERQEQQSAEQRRQLERLQRDLQQAAEDLNREQQDQAAQDLERGAEDLNRMGQQQMSEEEMQRLQQRLSELRELIRRQRQQQQAGQGGQGQGQQGRMERFVLRARGQGDQQGQGVPLGVPGQQGQQGQQGQGQGQGQGQQQQGGAQQGGQRGLMLGQGGNAQLEIPGMGMGQSRQGQGQQQGRQQPGPGAGTGHDPQTLDDPTRLGSSRQNMRVEGEHREGPTRSEVILGAADRGFVSRDYRRVYTEYQQHADEVLEQDEIPAGYRFYVRRYFQLIRPREAEPPAQGQRQ